MRFTTGTENANGVAGFFYSQGCGRIHDASEASRYAGSNDHRDAIAGDGGGIDPRGGSFDGKIINQEASLEIIGAVEDKGKAREEFANIFSV